MKRQGSANVTVRLTDEQHFELKYIALRAQTTMKQLLTDAIAKLVRQRWNGEAVDYEPSRRDTKSVLLLVDEHWRSEARAQAIADNIFFTAFYTTAALTVLSEYGDAFEAPRWQ